MMEPVAGGHLGKIVGARVTALGPLILGVAREREMGARRLGKTLFNLLECNVCMGGAHLEATLHSTYFLH